MTKLKRELQDLGYGIHLVPLTRGMFALIDSADAEYVGRHNWCAVKGGHMWYAAHGGRRDNKAHLFYLHRELMGDPCGLEVDHKNRDGLDCRRENLRTATKAQNQFNCVKQRNSKSPYKGVAFNKRANKWVAFICAHGKKLNLGYFSTPEEAHAAYSEAAKRLHGEFANTGGCA